MTQKSADIAPIRILPDDVSNKIAAGEVVERPASVVKELVENALDAQATRITVRVVAAGRRLIEVLDNGHGMSEQNALLAIERHATSKIRTAQDIEGVLTMGFRGEALASIASVSRFELVTRRAKDEAASRLRIDGGVLRDVSQTGAPVGTRISVNQLYFNTPVRAKFLKGITTELGHCIDIVQRHALVRHDVGFQFFHNDKCLLDIPEHADLRERVALIWGLNFVQDMVEVTGEGGGMRLQGLIGLPGLTRAQRSHQFFFMNRRPVVNRALQYGFEEGYRSLVTIGRHPVGVVLLETHPRFVDVNIHPTKREIRFRDERAARNAVRDMVRQALEEVTQRQTAAAREQAESRQAQFSSQETPATKTAVPADTSPEVMVDQTASSIPPDTAHKVPPPVQDSATQTTQTKQAALSEPAEAPTDAMESPEAQDTSDTAAPPAPTPPRRPQEAPFLPGLGRPRQASLPTFESEEALDPPMTQLTPEALYTAVGQMQDAPIQVFDTYLIVPEADRLLIIDQHALHERLNFDQLMAELNERNHEAQQLAVPIVFEVAPAQVRLLESNLGVFTQLGLEIEPFGGNSFQLTAICHLYEDSKVVDVIYHILDELAQGDLFDRENFLADALRVASRACKASVRGGDRLTHQERKALLEGFRRLRPPYTCPHGRPIITELTLRQMEKSFRRIQ